MAHRLPPDQARVIEVLESEEELEVGEVAKRLGLDQAQVAGAAVSLEQGGWLSIRTEELEEWSLDPSAFVTKDGAKDDTSASFASKDVTGSPLPRPTKPIINPGESFPDAKSLSDVAAEHQVDHPASIPEYLASFESPRTKILRALLEHGGQGAIADVSQWTGLDPKEVGQAIRPLAASGWAMKKGGTLESSLTAVPDLVSWPAGLRELVGANVDTTHPVAAEEELVIRALAAGPRTVDSLRQAGVTNACIDRTRELAPQALPKGAFVTRKRRRRYLKLTHEGKARRDAGVEAIREVSQLTPELLASGEWRHVRFKPYDIDLATEPTHPGKRHPLQRVIERTRQAFLEMGFEEAVSPYVESGFWDFDALFQPQDHPAREMQDTFYVQSPGRSPLPADAALVRRVRETHENGGATGSVGWRYRWDPEKAERNVLRTHTTATTIRELAKNPRGPRKVFSIGRVYRRETIDYKHLPIFFQVDGIIIDENASLSTLLGTLAAFYERMGFEKFYFRPGFFPYTEPSVEVFIWHEAKQDWFEMGGSGIFRPEVTEPLGCTQPVLAWGLGLDRLAMLLYDRSDIRDLYLADLEWLRTEPRCR